MLFPLRAAVVIGAIFYFSPLRPPMPWSGAPGGADLDRAARDAAAAVPADVRDRALRAGAEVVLRHLADRDPAGGREPDPPRRDTLRETDRAPSWRGAPLPPARSD